MNREIKFRAWEPLNEKMIYFDGFIPFQIGEMYIEGALNLQNQEKKYLTTMNFDAIEMMEFSGLKDKSDKQNEVYEGDIIEQFGWKGEYYIVEFIDCAFYAVLINNNIPKCLRTKYIKLDELYDFQVIGNKYDDLDLLKGEI